MEIEAEPLESRYRLARIGFLLAALACGLMAFDAAGHTVMMVTDDQALGQLFESEQWLWWASTGVAWFGLLGTLALVGRWPTPYWRERTTILLVLAAVGVVLWAIRHGHRLGLFETEAPWPWFRLQLSLAFRWAWMLILVDLAGRVAEHLGHAEAGRLRQIVRTLILLGIAAWLFLIVGSFGLGFGRPVLLPRRLWAVFLLQWFFFSLTRAVSCFATTLLVLLTARECRAFLHERKQLSSAPDLPPA
ncbi:MAG: hypothetical protein KatS3mg108_1553 [Isosphaeraceae bacterium]|jgi:hypothetical protein|nr:MAG: hypothetical protein KatS3mg108_1553 [Isosphaeraceae bacterium]